MKIDGKIKWLFKDTVFILLTLNMLWVIIGYALGKTQGQGAVAAMRIFKTVFVLGSFIYILYINGISTYFVKNKISIYIVVLAVSLLSFFSDKPFDALYKSLTFAYPLLYILYTINYLLRYGFINLLVGLSAAILITYSIVPLSFYFLGGSLEDTSTIYGYTQGEFFVSNHYGWGSALFILSALTLIKYYPLKYRYKIFIFVLLPFVFYLLIASANRAGILSIIIAFIFYLTSDKNASRSNKLLLTAIIVFIVGVISLQENSAIEIIQARNDRQIETGTEGRLIGTNAMLVSFNRYPVYWFTGVGMFNYTELRVNGGVLGEYHNSYWEILFGSGMITFILFLNFMLIRPIRMFFKATVSYSLLIIPLLIIPFFESNLTAGQFLFFPWFSYMILLNAKELDFYIDNKKRKKRPE